MNAPDAGLVVSSLTVDRGGHTVLHDVSLSIPSEQLTVVIGPSGSGKSTLLRAIAGLLPTRSGRITLGGVDLSGVPPERRNIGMVFQDFSLYETKTVAGNIAFPLRVRGLRREHVSEQVELMAAELGLTDKLARLPETLSGGERQRVALARALVRDPKVFLFDEPLSNVDAVLQEDLRALIVATHRRSKVPAIYVTHNRADAWRIAEQLVVLVDGRVVQAGAPRDLYTHPISASVAQLVGDDALYIVPLDELQPSNRELVLRCAPRSVSIGFRATHASIDSPVDGEAIEERIAVDYLEFFADTAFAVGRLGNVRIRARTQRPVDGAATLRVPLTKVYGFDHDGRLTHAIEFPRFSR